MRITGRDGRPVCVAGAPDGDFAVRYLDKLVTHDNPDAVDDSAEIEAIRRNFPGVLEEAEAEGRWP